MYRTQYGEKKSLFGLVQVLFVAWFAWFQGLTEVHLNYNILWQIRPKFLTPPKSVKHLNIGVNSRSNNLNEGEIQQNPLWQHPTEYGEKREVEKGSHDFTSGLES